MNDKKDNKNDNKNSTGLRIIEGNLLIDPIEAGGDFVSAEATNTRLMGVVGVHILRDQGSDTFHQFFYIDTEEYGLDDYQSFLGMTDEEAEKKKTELFGALGGDWKSITEKEALFLVRNATRINSRRKLPLPEGLDEYRPIIQSDVALTLSELAELWEKITIKPRNDYELINYYIMRMVASDSQGMRRLSAPRGDLRPINVSNPGTLLRNEITKDDSTDKNIYTCVSLMDIDKNYQLVESQIEIVDHLVKRFIPKPPLEISPWETSLILNQSEYLIYATIKDSSGAKDDDKHFSKLMSSIFDTLTESEYDFGTLYMVLRKNNDHVRNKIYRLDHDTLGVVCHLYTDEVVIEGNDILHVETIEKMLLAASLVEKIDIEIKGRYKFPEPVLVRFIDSNLERFSDFLEYIQKFQDS